MRVCALLDDDDVPPFAALDGITLDRAPVQRPTRRKLDDNVAGLHGHTTCFAMASGAVAQPERRPHTHNDAQRRSVVRDQAPGLALASVIGT